MFNTLLKHITEGNTYFGLEVFETDEHVHFSLLQLKLKKGELEVILEKTSDSLEALMPLLKVKAPLFVTLNTSKILKKEVAQGKQENHEHLVVNAFPNLDLDSFYYQVVPSNNNGIVAIGKKEYVDGYLELLHEKGISSYSLVLGIAQLQNISSFVQGSISGSNFKVNIDQNDINGLQLEQQPSKTKVELNGVSLSTHSLLSFSYIVGHLQSATQWNNLGNLNTHLKNTFQNSRVFDLVLKGALLFFLTLLLGNFLVFNNYSSKNQSLESTLLVDGQNDQLLVQLKEEILTKEERIKTLAQSKNSKTSLFLDEIAKELPKSIWLSDVKFQPLLFPLRSDKPIELNKNNIEISGIINDKIAFTVWSDNLEMKEWVNKVEIVDYEYISNSSANFTINIVLHEVQ